VRRSVALPCLVPCPGWIAAECRRRGWIAAECRRRPSTMGDDDRSTAAPLQTQTGPKRPARPRVGRKRPRQRTCKGRSRLGPIRPMARFGSRGDRSRRRRGIFSAGTLARSQREQYQYIDSHQLLSLQWLRQPLRSRVTASMPGLACGLVGHGSAPIGRADSLIPRAQRAAGDRGPQPPASVSRPRETSLAAYPIPWEGQRKWRRGRNRSGRLCARGDSRREPALIWRGTRSERDPGATPPARLGDGGAERLLFT
jgi:hypothetical protein